MKVPTSVGSSDVFLVVWEDSTTVDPWTVLTDDMELPPATIKSVGFLLQEKQNYVVLMGSFGEKLTGTIGPSAFGILTIPRSAIYDMRRMTFAPVEKPKQ